MKGLEKLDEMIFHTIESVASGKDITAEDIEYAAEDLYPKYADLIITVIQNKPEFMELWGRQPSIQDMYLAVVEALPKEYTKQQFTKMAKELFPDNWITIEEYAQSSE